MMTVEINKNNISNEFDEYQYLLKYIQEKPDQDFYRKLFFNNYESGKKPKKSETITYYQLKALYGEDQWQYFNDLASIYENLGKKSLASLCLITSLNINPSQKKMFNKVYEYIKSGYSRSKVVLKQNECPVSIIMSTYNRDGMICDSIDSVLNQTFQDYELIVINDGGSDNVKKIIDSYNCSKINYFKHKHNQGNAVAWNTGIKNARGKYIAYLDDDDIYYPNHLEVLVNFLERKPEYDLVYSNAWWCYGKIENKRFKEKYRKLNPNRPNKFNRELLFNRNYISNLNVVHKKSCFNNVDLFNEDFTQIKDWDLWIRFSKKFKFYQFNKITGEYRWKHENLSVQNRLEKNFNAYLIRNYHSLNSGKIAFLKYFMENDLTLDLNSAIDELITEYKYLVKTKLLIKELFMIGGKINSQKFNTIKSKIIRKYFEHEPIICIRQIIEKKSIVMFCIILVKIPSVLLQKLIKMYKTKPTFKTFTKNLKNDLIG